MLNLEDVLKLSDSLTIRNEDKVIFNFKKNSIFECNDVAFDILNKLEKPKRVNIILQEVLDEYEETSGLRNEVLEFLTNSWVDGIIIKEGK